MLCVNDAMILIQGVGVEVNTHGRKEIFILQILHLGHSSLSDLRKERTMIATSALFIPISTAEGAIRHRSGTRFGMGSASRSSTFAGISQGAIVGSLMWLRKQYAVCGQNISRSESRRHAIRG